VYIVYFLIGPRYIGHQHIYRGRMLRRTLALYHLYVRHQHKIQCRDP
jgi:hypothetical protein